MIEESRLIIMQELVKLSEEQKIEAFKILEIEYEKELEKRRKLVKCLEPELSAATYIACKYRFSVVKNIFRKPI